MKIVERIENFRKLMNERGVDAWIVPSSDPHQSEYVADRWKGRAWISGFTGSAGTVVITKDKGGLWTDGRYFLQAEEQLSGSGIDLFKMGMPETPSFVEWLSGELADGAKVGFDPAVLSVSSATDLEETLSGKGISLWTEEDLLDLLWNDRPAVPGEKIALHPIEFAGVSREEKITAVREEMNRMGATHHLVSSLDDVAWLYNIRGKDVECNPVAIAHAVVSMSEALLFTDEEKLSECDRKALEDDGVTIRPYAEVEKYLEKVSEGKIYIDPAKTGYNLYKLMKTEVLKGMNITTPMKARKNCNEIEGMRESHRRDGAAMVRFLRWLENNIGREKITEITASEKLTEFRKQGDDFVGPSFSTIAGYAEHGAIIHYSASVESDKELEPKGLFLLDSGGQYLDGTTDITRTVALGEVTEEERRNFTLVLKGHIGVAMTQFPEGTTGAHLDVLARAALWNNGLNYAHGTGHGVGAYLNVHEGPQNISPRFNGIALEKGMILSNEPGFYKAGAYGIRIENLVVVEEGDETEYGSFLRFEDLTLCPMDRNLIVPELMSDDELDWLNSYHADVYKGLCNLLDEDEREWLKEKTAPITH